MKIHHVGGYINIVSDGVYFETYNLERSCTRTEVDLHLKWKQERIESCCVEIARKILALDTLLEEQPSLIEGYLEG